MNYKTLEEMFIDKYKQLEDNYQLLKIELDQKNKKSKDETVISVSDHTGIFYITECQAYYNYNDILLANNYTPELVKSALTNEEDFNKFMNLERKDRSWYGDKVAKVQTRTYQYLFNSGEHIGALIYSPTLNEPFSMYCIDNVHYFLDKDKAWETAKVKVREQINAYFSYKHDEKFKPKEKENGFE